MFVGGKARSELELWGRSNSQPAIEQAHCHREVLTHEPSSDANAQIETGFTRQSSRVAPEESSADGKKPVSMTVTGKPKSIA
jgi:hypothetical protein